MYDQYGSYPDPLTPKVCPGAAHFRVGYPAFCSMADAAVRIALDGCEPAMQVFANLPSDGVRAATRAQEQERNASHPEGQGHGSVAD